MNLWMPSNWFLAQIVHVSLGLLFPLIFVAKKYPWWWGAILIMIIAVVKEFTFDPAVEHATIRDGFIDVMFYLAGVGLATLLEMI